MIWLILFAALQAVDVTLTALVLRKGGRELNPIMRWFMARLGMIPGLAVPKVIALGVLAAINIEWFTIAACALYAAVAAWNLKEYLKNA